MYAVPRGLREASFGLGARRKATSLRIVVPAAVSGIVAAMIVGFSRALGETMVVAIAAGGSGGSTLHAQPTGLRPDRDGCDGRARDRHRPGRRRRRQPSRRCSSSGCCCSCLTFMLNLISERFVRRYRRALLMAIATDVTTLAGRATRCTGSSATSVGRSSRACCLRADRVARDPDAAVLERRAAGDPGPRGSRFRASSPTARRGSADEGRDRAGVGRVDRDDGDRGGRGVSARRRRGGLPRGVRRATRG